jgi:hypothetical protein
MKEEERESVGLWRELLSILSAFTGCVLKLIFWEINDILRSILLHCHKYLTYLNHKWSDWRQPILSLTLISFYPSRSVCLANLHVTMITLCVNRRSEMLIRCSSSSSLFLCVTQKCKIIKLCCSCVSLYLLIVVWLIVVWFRRLWTEELQVNDLWQLLLLLWVAFLRIGCCHAAKWFLWHHKF